MCERKGGKIVCVFIYIASFAEVVIISLFFVAAVDNQSGLKTGKRMKITLKQKQ